MNQKNLIVAAGGILFKIENGELNFAVVRATKHNTWCLPKGKANKSDDSLLNTAIREVQEETGCLVEPLEYAGEFRYSSGKSIKLVLIWHMKLIHNNWKPLHPDICEVRWQSPIETVAMLGRKRERRFLSRVLAGNENKLLNFTKMEIIQQSMFDNVTVARF